MPSLDVIKNLVNNATLLFALVQGYALFKPHLSRNPWLRQLLQGSFFGVFGLLNMLTPFQTAPGVLIDARTMITAFSGAQGGVGSAFVTASLVSLYRITLGGTGVTAGLVAIWSNALLGSLVYHYLQRKPASVSRLTGVLQVYFGLGLGATLLTILPIFMLPSPAQLSFQGAVIPLLLVLPATCMLLASLLFQQERHFDTRRLLADERNLLRTLIDNVPDYIFIKDRQLRFLVSNLAHTRASSVASDQELIGNSATGHFAPELTAQYEADDRRVLAGVSLLGQERQSVDGQGELIYVSTTKVPFRNADGLVTGIIGISRDITAEKLRQQQEQQLLNERQYSRILKSFIQNASHDFRTPLSIISTKSYLLWRDPQGGQRDERLTAINDQITRISQFLDDMLDMIQLEEGTLRFSFGPTDVAKVVRVVADQFKPQILHNCQTLELIAPENPVIIDADEQRLTMAIKQLLANASAYTPEHGRITLRMVAGQHQLRITVEDNGMGIAPEDQPHIFEPVYRGDKARSNMTGGNGLGLTITQKIIERHHGSISFTTALGRGTTFFVDLPLTQPEEQPNR